MVIKAVMNNFNLSLKHYYESFIIKKIYNLILNMDNSDMVPL